MKKLIALFAFATGLSALTLGNAQAGPHSSSPSFAHTCGSCGGVVYRQRVVVSYNHCGDPVYAWRTSSHRCAPRHHDRDSGGGHHQGNGHNGRSKGHHHGGH